MIMIYQILKQVRISKDYSVKHISTALNQSDRRTNESEQIWKKLSDEVLLRWLKALDIPMEDWGWFLCQHSREIHFKELSPLLPLKLRLVLASHMSTNYNLTEVCVDKICSLIQQETIKLLPKRPRSADNAIDIILLRETE